MNSQSQTSQMRRYDLPTCLLEVWSERSPLSEWTDRPVAKNLRFRLRIEQQTQQKVIKGNQSQMTRLIEAVITHVDRLLSSDRLPDLTHTLTIPNFHALNLSTLQLFDLFTSLEQCADEIAILPSLELEVRRVTPAWLKIVAVAIASVGVTLGGLRLLTPQSPSLQIASTPNSNVGSSSEQATSPQARSGVGSAKTSPNQGLDKDPSKAPNGNVAMQPSQPNLSQPNSNKTAPLPSVQTPSQGNGRTQVTPNIGSTTPTTPTMQPNFGTTDDRFRRPEIDKVSVAPPASVNTPSGAPAPLPMRANPIVPNLEPKLEERQQPETSVQSGHATVPSPSGRDLAAERKVDETTSGSVTSSTTKPVEDAMPRLQDRDRPSAIKVVSLESVDTEIGLRKDTSNAYITSLSEYLQTLRLPSTLRGRIEIELVLRDRHVESVAIDTQSSNFYNTDSKASVDEIQRSLLNWTVPQALQGSVSNAPVKLRLVLQIQ
ncbi:DUF4335 domain-containing protein [Tumidithrix elongata RA019]|uniref:DUF4335 domain-containing protein n=1 Tax=Tumidithrix elongata BACA0141 TaxID=2716417 RepID=A0AAW9PZU8_9CYAN|nr:DUF4335 domain-containing protein [Tumidithrix elongata RA019]